MTVFRYAPCLECEEGEGCDGTGYEPNPEPDERWWKKGRQLCYCGHNEDSHNDSWMSLLQDYVRHVAERETLTATLKRPDEVQSISGFRLNRASTSAERVEASRHVIVLGEPGPFFDLVTRLLSKNEVGGVRKPWALYELLTLPNFPVSLLVIAPDCTDAAALEVGRRTEHRSPTTSIVMVRDRGWDGQLKDALGNGIHAVVSGGSLRSLRETLEWALDRTARLQAN
jgi:hypothetical protein